MSHADEGSIKAPVGRRRAATAIAVVTLACAATGVAASEGGISFYIPPDADTSPEVGHC